jgi:hypothetical protein
VCRILGYPVPSRFRKTHPRFPGQLLDTYVQKSNNLQIWNEEISPNRRYALIRLDAQDTIVRVKVVTGDVLAALDTTGTLTQKYQARFNVGKSRAELITPKDTDNIYPLVSFDVDLSSVESPTSPPVAGQLLSISTIFKRLEGLVGTSFADKGSDQERNRGSELHKLVCRSLGYRTYQDDGKFPDIPHQLLEVKLQTSPTIDLGTVNPSSTEVLDMPQVKGRRMRHCDARYALFGAVTDGNVVTLTNIYLITGERFFDHFTQFQGKVSNKKLQIPLPSDFFDI